MTDRTKAPEGYRVGFSDDAWNATSSFYAGTATKPEAVAACWTEVDKQRAIGIRMAAKEAVRTSVDPMDLAYTWAALLNDYADLIERGEA